MKPLVVLILLCMKLTVCFCQNDFKIDQTPHNIRVTYRDKFIKTETFKDFSVLDDYFVFKKDNLYTIFSTKTGKKLVNNVRVYMTMNGQSALQLLKGNTLIWLYKDSIVTAVPDAFQVLCGNVDAYIEKIIRQKDSLFLQLKVREDMGSTISYQATHFISRMSGTAKLQFLNDSDSITYYAGMYFSTNLNPRTFILTTSDNKKSIIHLNIDSNKTSINTVLDHFEVVYKDSILNDLNLFRHFIYKKDKLYGYFPTTLKAKYAVLKPFEGNFAPFVLPNGKRGWLAKNGKEYYYE